MLEELRVQRFQHFCRAHFVTGDNAQRFTGIFVNYREHFVFATTAQPVMNEVDAPDMIGVFRA